MQDTIIDLIRHGEPVGGRAYRGHNIDDPLSEKGWQQMWDAVADQCPWDVIVSSSLSRCLSFARALAEDNQKPLVVVDDLKEVGFGSWEGKTPDDLKRERLEEYNAFYADPVNQRPPGAEDLDVFFNRVNAALSEVINQFKGSHLLVVAHAGVIRAVIASSVMAPQSGMYNIKVANAGITRIRFSENNKVTLELLNSRLSTMN